MRTDWLQMLDEYWDEKGTPYLDYFDFWPGFFLNIAINCH